MVLRLLTEPDKEIKESNSWSPFFLLVLIRKMVETSSHAHAVPINDLMKGLSVCTI